MKHANFFQDSLPNNYFTDNNLSEMVSQTSLYSMDTRLVDLDMWSQQYYSMTDVTRNNALNHHPKQKTR